MTDLLWRVDWPGILMPTLSVLEMLVRGTIMYFVIFALMRVVLKRESGRIGTADVLVIVLVSEVAGNGFAAGYKSLIEGVVLVATILFWTSTIERLAHRFSAFERFLRPTTVTLVEDGRMLRHNMRAELVTKDELMAQLREHGIEVLGDVKRARMEADGRISVIKMKA